MGYTTEFDGAFQLDRPLEKERLLYLNKFSENRRMKRDARQASKLTDSVREAVKLPIGPDGAFFVGGTGSYGQDRDVSVTDYNFPPKGQPGLWCQWVPNDDGNLIEWNGVEKFYNYVEWLEYLIVNFFGPWGYSLNGEVAWSGEDVSDVGKIQVTNNKVKVLRPKW